MLSVIIPAFCEAETLETMSGTLNSILTDANIDYEVLFVDDGSTDNTWEIISRLHGADKRFKGVHFSRNFGKDPAIFAGLKRCRGDCAVVLDCDLQHPPEKIVDMYRLWEQGYEVVEGIENTRGSESRLHRAGAELFYRWMSKVTKIDMRDTSDFKLLDRKVINALAKMPEHRMFFRTLSSWVGYKRTSITYDVGKRFAGSSKWSTVKLMKYAASSVTSFTSHPMQIVTWFGVIMLAISVFVGIWSLVDKIVGRAIEGMTTVIFLLLFTGSIIMISLGIIGYYISRIFEEVQARPRYIVDEFLDE